VNMIVFILIIQFVSNRNDAPTVVIDNIYSQWECLRVMEHIKSTQPVKMATCLEVRKAR